MSANPQPATESFPTPPHLCPSCREAVHNYLRAHEAQLTREVNAKSTTGSWLLFALHRLVLEQLQTVRLSLTGQGQSTEAKAVGGGSVGGEAVGDEEVSG